MQPENQPNQPPDIGGPDKPGPDIPQTTDNPNPAATPASIAQPAPKQGRSKKKLFAIVAVVAILLLGGSAAAYLGVYVPNQPENVLKSALENTAKEKQAKFEGNFDVESLDEENPYAAKVDFSGQADSNTGNLDTTLEVTVSGIKVNLDARVVDNSVYVKVGDLSGVKGLAAIALPGSEAILDEANKKLADQWIEIDETLLKTADADCSLGLTKMTLTDQDFQILENRYKEVQFATIKSTSDEDVNGNAATKFEIEIDDNKLNEYAKELDDLSIVKKAKECGPQDAENTEAVSNGGKTPLTLWVDKDRKLITKVALDTSLQTEEQEKTKGSIEMTIDYTAVQISKPENSRPFMEVIGELGGLSERLQSSQLQ